MIFLTSRSGVSGDNLWITLVYSPVTPNKISLRGAILFSPILGWEKFFVILITLFEFDIFTRCVLVLLYEENK